MRNKPAIGVCDLGASGGRFFLMFPKGKGFAFEEIYRFSHSYQTFFQVDSSNNNLSSRFCWDLGRIYSKLLEGLKRLSAVDGIELESFGIDTWGSDGIWITERGDMLGQVGTGRDPRWSEARSDILKIISARELFDITGIQSHPFNVLNQIYWYFRNESHVVEAAATYMPVHSLLYYFLTGERVAEYSWLSTTQLTHAGSKDYAVKVFDHLNLRLDKMPTIERAGRSLGLCRKELAQLMEIPQFEVILPAVHDTACSYAVSNADIDGHTMIISTGTWFLAGAKLSFPQINKEAFDSGFSNEGGYSSVRFLKNVMGSWPAQQLRKLWMLRDGQYISWEQFEELVWKGNPFNCVLDVDHPLFFSADDMELAVLEYCRKSNQRPPKTREDMARAVYEGIAMKVAITAQNLGSVRSTPTREILIVGGIVHSRILNQWFADASDMPVRLGMSDATAYGNAVIQAVARGWADSVLELATAPNNHDSEKVIEPQNVEPWKEPLTKLKDSIHIENNQ